MKKHVQKNILWLILACALELALIGFTIFYCIFFSFLALPGAIIPVGAVGMVIYYLLKSLTY